MKTTRLMSVAGVFALSVLSAGCGGGGDDFSQPIKPLGGDTAKVEATSEQAPDAPPAPAASVDASVVSQSPAAKAPAAPAAESTPAGQGKEGEASGGLFGSADAAPTASGLENGASGGLFAPAEATAAASMDAPLDVAGGTSDDGLAADLSSDGRLLVAERGDGRFGVYEVNRRINLMSLKAAENNIKKVSFDSVKGLISAILPSGKVQVWKYQNTVGLDKFAKESIASDSFLRGFEGHPGGTLDLAFSPSRDEMVTVGADGQLRFWRINDSTSTRSFEKPGTELQHLVTSINGSFAAASTARGIVTIWDTTTGKAKTMPVGDRAITCLAVDTKGSLLAAGDSAGTLVLLEVANGLTNELSLGSQAVADIRFEEESQRLFAISVDGETRAWNLPLSAPSTIEGLSAAGGLLAVSADRKRVLAPNLQGGLRSVTLSGDATVQEIGTGLTGVTSIEFADGDSVAIGNEKGQVEIQEASGLRKLITTGDVAINQLTYSIDGLLATLNKRGSGGIWHSGGSEIVTSFSDDQVVTSANDSAASVLTIAFRSGKQIVVDLSNGQTIATRQANKEEITCTSLDARRGMVVSGHASGNISLWDFREKSELITLGKHAAAVSHVHITESGKFAISGAGDGTVCNWPTQRKETATASQKMPAEIRLAEFATNQAIGVAATETGVFTIDLASGTIKELSGVLRPARLQISADGLSFASITVDGVVGIYQVADGTLLRQHLATDQIVDVEFLTVERTYLSLDGQGGIKRWNRPESNLAAANESLKGASRIWLNPSGSILAVAVESNLIRFLSVAEDFKVLSTVTVESGVQLLAWIGDQSCAVTSPAKNSVSLVELQGGRVQKTLVDLPGPATQFCRRADNGDLLAICGTRLLKVRPVSGDIRVNDISFKASDKDQLVNCGNVTLLFSGGRIFRIGREDNVVIDERVANVKSLSGSVSEQAAVVITESGNMLVYSDNKFTDAGVNPLPDSTISVSDDGQYLWVKSESEAGLVWSVRDKKILQKVDFSGAYSLRSWLPNQRALVQVGGDGTVSLSANLVTAEWSTSVTNARSFSVSPGGNLALVRSEATEAIVLDMANGKPRPIELPDAMFAELTDDVGTVLAVSGSGKLDRISATESQTLQVESPVRSVSVDRSNRTCGLVYGDGKSGVINIDQMIEMQSLANVQSTSGIYSTTNGFLLADANGVLTVAESGGQSAGQPRAGHPGGCSGIATLQNQVLTSGRDGVIRSWSPDLSNHRDVFKHSRALVALSVSAATQQIIASDELGEVQVISLDGTVRNPANKVGLGPGSRTVGQDKDGNLVVIGGRQAGRFRPDGIPGDGVQFKEDCVDLGAVGTDGKWFGLEKNGNLYSFSFVNQRHSIQRSSKITGLHWARPSELAVVSGKQVEVISADGEIILSNAVAETEIVATGMSSDGQRMSVLSVSGDLIILDTQTLAKTSSFKPGFAANRIAMSSTGETMLLFGVETAEEWNADGIRLRKLPVTGVTSASYVEGSPFLITALKSGEVRQWPRQQMFSSRPSSAVKDSRLLPQAAGAIFVDEKGLVRAENADSKVLWQSQDPVQDFRKSSFSSDGSRIALLTVANGVRRGSVYDQKGVLLKAIDIPQNCNDIQISPDGTGLMLNAGKSMEIRNVDSGLVTQSLNIAAKKCLYATGNSLLFVDNEGGLRVMGTGELGNLQISSGQGTAVAFDETGDRLATGTSEGVITVWDRSSPELKKLHELKTESPVRQIIFRSSMLIARTDLAAMSIWLLESADPASTGTMSFAHRGVPQLAEVDRKHELLATVSSDNEVSVWDLSNRGSSPRQVLSVTGHDQRIAALAFSEASDSLVTLDASGTVSINPLPDLFTLRQRASAEVMARESSGLLEELPLSMPDGGRSGNHALSQKLRQEDSVRRDLQALRAESQGGSEAGLANRRPVEDVVQSIGTARSSQIRGLYRQRGSRDGGSESEIQSGTEQGWTPPPGVVEDFRSIKALPAAIAATASAESAQVATKGTEPQKDDAANELVRRLVASQRSFVTQLTGSAVSDLEKVDSGSPVDQKSVAAFRQQLEQMLDSRAIQTITTSYRFPRSKDEANAIRVALQISSDGSTVASSFPPLTEIESKGHLDIWDTLSGIALKQYETTEGVEEMLLSATEDQLLTMPSVSAYQLFESGAPRYLTHCSSVAWCRVAESPMVAFTRRVQSDALEQLLAFYDSRTLDIAPLSMPEGFDTVARSIAFASTDDRLAFGVSERGKDHKLFICKTTDLARFEVLTPIDLISSGSDKGVGFPALTFSADGQALIAVAHEGEDTTGFSVRLYGLKDKKWVATSSMPLAAEGFAGVGDPITVHFVAQMQRVCIRTGVGVFVGDLNPTKKRGGNTIWTIPLNPQSTSAFKFSDDGRWLARGQTNGVIEIHDLSSSDPTVAVPLTPEGDSAHDAAVIGLSFSRPLPGTKNPTYLASFGRENRLKVWSLIDIQAQLPQTRKSR